MIDEDVELLKDACDILELSIRDVCSPIRVRKKYREMAKRYHPDKKNQSDGAKFLEIKKAFDTIMECRERFDGRRELFNTIKRNTISRIIDTLNKNMKSDNDVDTDVGVDISTGVSSNNNDSSDNKNNIEIDETITLSPTAEDILYHRVYKLKINENADDDGDENILSVPLWITEPIIYSKGNGWYVEVVCEPDLPEHMYIKDGALYVKHETVINVNTDNTIDISLLPECEPYSIQVKNLLIRRHQVVPVEKWDEERGMDVFIELDLTFVS